MNELFVKLPVSKLKIPEGPSLPFLQNSNPISELADRPVKRSTINGKCNSEATPIARQDDLSNLLIPSVAPDKRLPTKRPANIVTDGIKNTGSNAIPKARSSPVNRILMGQKRDSLALTNDEKEAIAYHEAGHALCAALLPNTDPLHKVTIIPSGMALGVTMQLPEEEKHIYRQNYIEDSLTVRMGGRVAEEIVFGIASTGANNDLVGATELAKKMVREWGMSEEVGPMAWGNQSQVFLGDDLMAGREYSDETARIIDEEIQKILVKQEDACRKLLDENRNALDLIARALLEHETISGKEVTRLIQAANGDTSIESMEDVAAVD